MGASNDVGAQGRQGHQVTVTIDTKEKVITEGVYKVSDLKTMWEIPPDYELDIVENGEFKPLNSNRSIHIKGGETFVSHVPGGGSS